MFALLKQFVKYIKLFKSTGTNCCDINVTCTESLSIPSSGTFSAFPAFEEKIVKFLLKTLWIFDKTF